MYEWIDIPMSSNTSQKQATIPSLALVVNLLATAMLEGKIPVGSHLHLVGHGEGDSFKIHFTKKS